MTLRWHAVGVRRRGGRAACRRGAPGGPCVQVVVAPISQPVRVRVPLQTAPVQPAHSGTQTPIPLHAQMIAAGRAGSAAVLAHGTRTRQTVWAMAAGCCLLWRPSARCQLLLTFSAPATVILPAGGNDSAPKERVKRLDGRGRLVRGKSKKRKVRPTHLPVVAPCPLQCARPALSSALR